MSNAGWSGTELEKALVMWLPGGPRWATGAVVKRALTSAGPTPDERSVIRELFGSMELEADQPGQEMHAIMRELGHGPREMLRRLDEAHVPDNDTMRWLREEARKG